MFLACKEPEPQPIPVASTQVASAPQSTSLPPPKPPPLSSPRIMTGVEYRVPKEDPEKPDQDKRLNARLQSYFASDAPMPIAGELVDVVGPKGYRFLGRIAFVKEETRFETGTAVGVGFFATIQPIDFIAKDLVKSESLLAMIPADPARAKRAAAANTAPELPQLPEITENAKLFSYADSDGDGTVDALAISVKGCRYTYFLEQEAWVKKKDFCGKVPEQQVISTDDEESSSNKTKKKIIR